MIGALLLTIFTVVQLNCENLFDCRHDSLKNDYEFLPESRYKWTPWKYWRKINRIGETIVACGGSDLDEWTLPDLVALCEVENDSVMFDLTKRSLLRTARYEYVMTNSPDQRGIDVALLYSPFTFQLKHSHAIRVRPLKHMRPTRDILYVCGKLINDDFLHVYVLHAPSRSGGVGPTEKYRLHVMSYLHSALDSLKKVVDHPNVLIMGDFNDYSYNSSIISLKEYGLRHVSKDAKGLNGAAGTYFYQGRWESLDHVFCSPSLMGKTLDCYIGDFQFLMEKDYNHGCYKPKRNYYGPRFNDGYSDHLPLIVSFRID